MAVEALASVSNGQSTSTSNEPIQKRPVNDTGRVSVNRALELGKGSDETIEKSINLGKPLEERFVKISDASSRSLTPKNNQASEENDTSGRRLLDDSVQKRIFDSEKIEERLQRSDQTLNQRILAHNVRRLPTGHSHLAPHRRSPSGRLLLTERTHSIASNTSNNGRITNIIR